MIIPANLPRPGRAGQVPGRRSRFRRSTDIPVRGVGHHVVTRCVVSGTAGRPVGPRRARTGRSRPGPAATVLASLVLTLLVGSAPARAQSFEDVGTRAQGMAGAFVAVTDDASATWWNPAGLAGGSYFSAIVERGQRRAPADIPDEGPAWQHRTTGFAAMYPAMGLSYYQFRVSERGQFESIGATEPGRQDQRLALSAVRSVAVSAFGLTVGQSIGRHLVVASTVRLLRAGVVDSADASGAAALDRADDRPVDRHTAADLDVGMLVRLGPVSLGGTVRHVGEPGFGDGDARLVMRRQARAGLAVRRGNAGVFETLVGAVDVDVTTTPTVFGDERRVAAGGEAGVLGGRIVVRGGLSTNTIGDRDWQPAVGASVALRRSVYLDGALAPGDAAAARSRAGWSVALRTAF